MSARYLARRLLGDGSEVPVHGDLPLSDFTWTKTLSGANAASATVPAEFATIKDDSGRPVIKPWSTSIYSEMSSHIRWGGIVTRVTEQGPQLSLNIVGFKAYADRQPYTDSKYWVEVDPIDMAREIWTHLQTRQDGNIGLTLDDTKSGKKIGTELEQVEFDTQEGPVSFEAGPYKLNWYTTDDLGGEFDKLAKETPFDYREKHYWADAAHTQIAHFLEIGYPRLGQRRPELRFVFGENIHTLPSLDYDGDNYANSILARGNGEGAAMLHLTQSVRDGNLRRVKVFADQSIKSMSRLTTEARRRLTIARTMGDLADVVVTNHPHAALGTWNEGDEILVQLDSGWEKHAVWYRVLDITYSDANLDAISMRVMRSDRVGLEESQ